MFAGCREVYRYKYHVNCIGASSQTEAEQKIQAAKDEKEKKRLQYPQTWEEKIEELKNLNADLRERIPDEALEIIEAEIKASRGEKFEESKDKKDDKNN